MIPIDPPPPPPPILAQWLVVGGRDDIPPPLRGGGGGSCGPTSWTPVSLQVLAPSKLGTGRVIPPPYTQSHELEDSGSMPPISKSCPTPPPPPQGNVIRGGGWYCLLWYIVSNPHTPYDGQKNYARGPPARGGREGVAGGVDNLKGVQC